MIKNWKHLSPKQTLLKSETRISKSETNSRNFEFQNQRQLFALLNDGAENFHQLLRFGHRALPFRLQVAIDVKQAKVISVFEFRIFTHT